jgi:hypothetical protein
VALVEGQEVGGRAGQPRGHQHHFGVHGKVHQRAALELEDGFAGVPVVSVLVHRALGRLAGERILELQCGDRNAVQTQRDVQQAA